MKTSRSLMVLSLAATALLAGSNPAEAASFREAKSRIYTHPLTTLPQETGLSIWGAAWLLIANAGPIIDRAHELFSTQDDFRDPTEAKLLHPMGVCAEGDWVITADGGTGMLAAGTNLKAIVRLSAGTEDVKFSALKPRVMGIAVKLFPTSDPDKDVVTANFHTLDAGGMDGSVRERFLGDGPSSRTYFENTAPGSGALATKLAEIFKAEVDPEPNIRQLYPLTERTADGAEVTSPVTPEKLRLVPKIAPLELANATKDFREEIRSYKAGQIVLEIQIPGKGAIGTLKLGKPVVSRACDREIAFAHAPTK